MNDNVLQRTITYGKIEFISATGIVVGDSGSNSKLCIEKKVYDDFSDLYIDEEVVVINYSVLIPPVFPCTRIEFRGVMDRKKYENPIRESQKLPKGWAQEPNVALVEDFGTVEGDANNMYIRPINEPDTLYSLNDYHVDGNLINHEDIVAQTYYITYPNGKKGKYKYFLPMRKYNKGTNKIRK